MRRQQHGWHGKLQWSQGPRPLPPRRRKLVLVGRLVSEPGIGFEVMKERFLGDDVVTRFLPVLRCVWPVYLCLVSCHIYKKQKRLFFETEIAVTDPSP
jgi:hypothetical protein